MPSPNHDARERIFIGDVHGCADELEELLEKLEYDPERQTLWFVGDLVNRGPHSLRTLRRVKALGSGAVLGNHNVHAVARWLGIRTEKPRDTLDELLAAPDAGDLLGWLRERPVVMVWDDLVMIHAGLNPTWDSPESMITHLGNSIDWSSEPLRDPDVAFAVTARQCDPTGRQPTRSENPDAEPFRPWDTYYEGRRTVVFGHWAQRGLVNEKRVRGIDTGCVWGGSLTAWRSGDGTFVSVRARDRYQEIPE